jgi:FMN phosphatase YigB (HAD superfamily)
MHFVFDFDHTIFDTGKLWNSWLDVLESAGVDREDSNEKGEEIFGKGFTLLEHAERLGLSQNESEELISSFTDYTFHESPELVFEDAIPFVKKNQKKHKFSILTFGDSDYQNEKISASGVGDYIDDVRIASPERLKAVQLKEILNETDERVVFVDDNPRELVAASGLDSDIDIYRMIRPKSRHSDVSHALDSDKWKCIKSFDEIEVS